MVVEDRKSQPDDVTISQNIQGQLQVKDGGVGTEKLMDSAVTENKFADNSVTANKIADGAITNSEINAAAAIDQSKLASLSVATDGSVSSVAQDTLTYTGSTEGNDAIEINRSAFHFSILK
jgi:hypothetical protein